MSQTVQADHQRMTSGRSLLIHGLCTCIPIFCLGIAAYTLSQNTKLETGPGGLNIIAQLFSQFQAFAICLLRIGQDCLL